MESLVCVGDRLGPADEFASGKGTYLRNGVLYASIVGQRNERQTDEPTSSTSGPSTLVEVISKGAAPVVPKPGDLVTTKVTRVTQNVANTLIKCVGNKPVDVEFRGVIRLTDVRATEIDKVAIHQSFRPGDIVKAQVLSLGDARSYYLTTAANELGVVHALSATAGVPMVPISWEEMQCPETLAVEKRKVAKTDAILTIAQ